MEQTLKIVRFILRDEELSVENALLKASNLSPYKIKETGRIFPIELNYKVPVDFVQKIEIIPDKYTSGEDTSDLAMFEYVFVPWQQLKSKKYPKGEPLMKVRLPPPSHLRTLHFVY